MSGHGLRPSASLFQHEAYYGQPAAPPILKADAQGIFERHADPGHLL